MISFIIIGKNEGVKIKLAIDSVVKAIDKCEIQDHQIIYVDSDSSDNSIQYAMGFPNVDIVELKGDVNAAIARNEGANIAEGNILFFIDGDMEIKDDFLPLVLNQKGELIYPFLSGEFVSIDKDYNGKTKKIFYHQLNKDTYQSTTGGIFLIERHLWIKMNGMKPKMRRSQDIDLGLRLTKAGFPLLRKKEVIADHYTTHYHNDTRLWKDLIKGNQMYQRSIMYREHIMNRAMYPFLFKEVSLFSLIFSLIWILVGGPLWVLLIYALVLIARLFINSKIDTIKEAIKFYIFYFFRDVVVLYGLFFFWPTNKNIFSKNITIRSNV